MSSEKGGNASTSHLDHALFYAANSWPVFPCRPNYETVVDERGRAQDKKPKSPLTQYGFKDATLRPHIIKRWWSDRPDALIGVPTGSRSGFWVLDVDVPGDEHEEDGRPWLERMEAEHGPLKTRIASTAAGGRHFYWRHVDGVRNKAALAPGVDTRGEGGYACMPGSVLPDGTFYEWENEDDIAEAPEWLIDLVTRKPPEVDYKVDRATEPIGFNEVREILGYVDPDCNYSDWVSVLMALHSEFGEDGLAIADDWSARGKKYRRGEVASKWRRFKPGGGVGIGTLCALAKQGGADLSAISRRHRGDHYEDNTRLVDISRMIERAREKAKAQTAADSSAAAEADSEPTPNAQMQPAKAETAEGIFITPYVWRDPKTLPRREFAFGTHYIRKYVSVTVSPGGLGKTSNSIVEALSMASGKTLLGIKPPKRMRVWLFNAEDPRDEMERRIQAACIHYKLGPDDINGWLFLDTGREQELVVAVDDRKAGVRYQVPIIESVIANLKANEMDVMIVDPFVSTHGVNENDNGAIDKVAKLWAHIADETNTAIDVVHHLRKVADREATVEDARGAVALIGAARSVRVLNRMSEDQATAANVPAGERFSYFNIHQGKSNLTKMSAAQDWRKLESVPLGNGKGLTKPQDHAGVVTEWRWPSSEEVAEGLTDEQVRMVCVTLDNGSYKAAANAKDWAGKAVAYALGIDLDDKAGRKRTTTVLKALLAEGKLTEVDERDPVSRMTARFVRSSEYNPPS